MNLRCICKLETVIHTCFLNINDPLALAKYYLPEIGFPTNTINIAITIKIETNLHLRRKIEIEN